MYFIHSIVVMSKHWYKVEDKRAMTVKDFMTKDGLVPTQDEMDRLTFMAMCCCGCHKKLYGSVNIPETSFLEESHNFKHWANPRSGTGPADAYRTATTARIAGGKEKSICPRHWDSFFHLCYVNKHLTVYSDLPEDFKKILQEKAPYFQLCWNAYNKAKDQSFTYENDDMLFNRAKGFLDLLPAQPKPSRCKSHKRKAEDGAWNALLEAGIAHASNTHTSVDQPAVVAINTHAIVEQPAVVTVNTHAVVEQPAVVAVNTHAVVEQPAVAAVNAHAAVERANDMVAFDNILQAGINIGIAYVLAMTEAAVHVGHPTTIPVDATRLMQQFEDAFGVDPK
jgi:hypothetical protein